MSLPPSFETIQRYFGPLHPSQSELSYAILAGIASPAGALLSFIEGLHTPVSTQRAKYISLMALSSACLMGGVAGYVLLLREVQKKRLVGIERLTRASEPFLESARHSDAERRNTLQRRRAMTVAGDNYLQARTSLINALVTTTGVAASSAISGKTLWEAIPSGIIAAATCTMIAGLMTNPSDRLDDTIRYIFPPIFNSNLRNPTAFDLKELEPTSGVLPQTTDQALLSMEYFLAQPYIDRQNFLARSSLYTAASFLALQAAIVASLNRSGQIGLEEASTMLLAGFAGIAGTITSVNLVVPAYRALEVLGNLGNRNE